jgi:hypothetical protein
MAKKLIDWATAPEGIMTNFGKVIFFMDDSLSTLTVVTNVAKTVSFPTIRCTSQSMVRLAPASEQHWLVYEEGATVVPDWAECAYRGFTSGIGGHIEKRSSSIAYIGTYRIVCIKDGWTDNPNEAIE